ncbi:MAG: LLM class flavin-dependent oxidoreductase [Acidimicrobiales bacterium]|nr:LLM class flavin-dependent oxidoreductase [Acidimicrobiales bacterium]
MKLGVTMPVEDGLSAKDFVRIAVEAEELGYDTVVCGEISGAEVMATLGMMAARTSRVRLASGIIPTTTRAPVLAAMGFATLSSMAPGRIAVGLGASSPIVVGDWHGRDFKKPLSTTRDFIKIFRAAISGEKVSMETETLRTHNFRLTIDPEGDLPIWLAAINDRMLRLAGAIADGVFLTWCPPTEVQKKVDLVRAGAIEAGRDPSEIEVVLSFWGFEGNDDDVSIVRERCRRSILAYAMVPTHQSAFLDAFPTLARAASAWEAGDRKKALDLTGDDVLEAMCPIGPPGVVSDRVRQYVAAGVDLPVLFVVGPSHSGPEPALQTMKSTARALALTPYVPVAES